MGAGVAAEGGKRNEVSPNYPAAPAMADGMAFGLDLAHIGGLLCPQIRKNQHFQMKYLS